MGIKSFRVAPRAAWRAPVAGALLLVSFAAVADDITLNGSGQLDWTAQFLGSASGNTQTTPAAPDGNTYTLAVPGQYGFLDQFTAPQSSPLVDGSNTPFENSGTPVGTYAFQDTYAFTIGAAASGDVLAVSLSLQSPLQSIFNISDLQLRLYEVPSASTPGLNIPAGSTLVTSWQGIPGNDSGSPIQATFSNLQSGTYFLDIAGTADGSSGGTYVGQLNLSPVPLPDALPLLLTGLGGLGWLARRRRLMRLTM